MNLDIFCFIIFIVENCRVVRYQREDVKLKKKIAACVITLVVLSIFTTIIAFANYYQQTIYQKNEDGITCTLKTYDSSVTGRVVISEKYNGVKVTAIDENAFLKCSGVTEVMLPKTVTSIGAFSLGYIENENGEKVKKKDLLSGAE